MRAPASRSRRVPLQTLRSALDKIADQQSLNWINTADYKRLGAIEGIAHELSHALDLGPNFETLLREMDDTSADEHAAAALRVELSALTSLGVRLSARRLWMSANWRGLKVPLARLRMPLDQHALDCSARFVSMVERELELLDDRGVHR